MTFIQRPRRSWRLRTRGLELGGRTLVMGILNVAPDSFSGDGCKELEQAVSHGLRHLDEGAAVLDLGGESTRPGSGAASERSISAAQEQDRVLPVIEGLLRERPDAILSIDTYRSSTARAAVAAGVEIVNDVSGLLWDDAMAATCAELACGLVLMHTRGRPDEWKTLPALEKQQVLPLVLTGLRGRLMAAADAGIAMERVVLDPGYGFGKASKANYALLRGQNQLLALGRPLMVGVSRKSFLGKTLGHVLGAGASLPVQRENATLAACVGAMLNGASVLRVHFVRPAVEVAAIADAILEG